MCCMMVFILFNTISMRIRKNKIINHVRYGGVYYIQHYQYEDKKKIKSLIMCCMMVFIIFNTISMRIRKK